MPRVIGVSARPGASTFTRIPRGASSRARLRAIAWTPALATTYGSSSVPGRIASDEPHASRTPPSSRCTDRRAEREHHPGEVDREDAVPLVEVERVERGARCVSVPALANTASSPPSAATISATAPVSAAGSVTSAVRAPTRPPAVAELRDQRVETGAVDVDGADVARPRPRPGVPWPGRCHWRRR